VNLLRLHHLLRISCRPPWYVQQYGFQFNPHTPANTAGLGRFDNLFARFGLCRPVRKSSNVFAAMPSLHASYPLIVLYYGIRTRQDGSTFFSGPFMVGIWFAAVYRQSSLCAGCAGGIICGLQILLSIPCMGRWVGSAGG